jgi:hypothetical protein
MGFQIMRNDFEEFVFSYLNHLNGHFAPEHYLSNY